MRFLDLFSGIGGFALGLTRAGMAPVAFCEIEPYCQRVLAKHWPEVPIHDNIRELDGHAFRDAVELVCGGFPCQPFSSASRGRANHLDLFPAMLRIIRQARPRWIIAENVPGIGLAGVDRVASEFEQLSYTVQTLDVDTSPPSRSRGRRRFFWLAHADRQSQSQCPVDAKMARLSQLPTRRSNDPCPLGMDDGVPARMDRLRGLGNAVVPQIVEILGHAIVEHDARC